MLRVIQCGRDAVFNQLMCIAAGGAAGALSRAFISWLLASTALFYQFPLATLLANLLGCFLIGCIAGSFNLLDPGQVLLRSALITGFLGSFTTFSTFSLETTVMLREGRTIAAVAYMALSVTGGIILCISGLAIFRSLSE